jgi:integrase
MKNIRKKGDGSFRKLPNGSVEFTVDLGNDVYGVRQRKRFYGKTESECRKKYKDFIKEGEKKPVATKEHTLASWLDYWLETYKKGNVEDSTFADYVYLAGHVKKHQIGGMKLPQVKPLHVTEYFSAKLDLSQSFRKRSKFLLNAAFECALDNEFCDRNPVRRAEISKKVQPEKEPFSEADAKIIAEFAKTDDLFGVAMYIMLNTGIRSGEMRAMQVSSIDFEAGVVTIDKAVKRTGELGLPKNNKTRRIPLEPQVTEFLRTKLQGKSGYILSGDCYVTHSGFRGRYEWFFDRLNRHRESLGQAPIDRKTPHASRHEYVK